MMDDGKGDVHPSGEHKRFPENPLPTLAEAGIDKNLANDFLEKRCGCDLRHASPSTSALGSIMSFDDGACHVRSAPIVPQRNSQATKFWLDCIAAAGGARGRRHPGVPRYPTSIHGRAIARRRSRPNFLLVLSVSATAERLHRATSWRRAGGSAYRPSSFGIGAEPRHQEHRRPSTSVPTDASGWRSTVRRSIARLVPQPGQ
jgi:hypothetical protein